MPFLLENYGISAAPNTILFQQNIKMIISAGGDMHL
jgi:hypothetical protein